jgi:transposase
MDVLYPRCAGLDVHKDTVVACARLVTEQGVTQEVAVFGTTTRALLGLADWLAGRGCTHVAMEATGVYWKPVWHVLEAAEAAFELVLANAAHIRNVPGRKTDVNDAMWIADLLAHGLIRGSFVPPADIQELRSLLRTRKQLVREQAQHVLRLQKTLEDANLKLASVVSDLMGVSGRAILEALIAGETRPERLVALTKGRLKASPEALREALRGQVTAHHRFLLKLHLEQVDALGRAIAAVEAEAGTVLAPFRARATLLTTIPGVSDTVAQAIISEIGVEMTRFPTAGHLISWAGLCPRQDESAGKRRSTRVRHSGTWLKTTLVQAAWSATRTKECYLRAQFLRLKSRRGPKKAIIAVAASILTAAYYMLRDGTEYRDLGADYFARLDTARLEWHHVQRLNALGYSVTLTPLQLDELVPA